MEPNTQCTRCGAPVYKQKSKMLQGRVYCSAICFHQARKEKKDADLCYVLANYETDTLGEMAKELKLSKAALEYRIACWRREGKMDGHTRGYFPRLKPEATSEYFDWLEFENDVIVGGNLFPDRVVGWDGELPADELPVFKKRWYRWSEW